MGEDIVCAPVTAADLGAVVALVGANNRDHNYSDAPFDLAAAEGALFGPAANLSAALAWREAEALGVALWTSAYETEHGQRGAYLCDLFVAPDHRRRGIGRALMRAAVAAVRADGGAYLWWVSQPWNERAHRFYAEIGATDEVVHAHALFGPAFEALSEASPSGPASKT